MDPGTCCFSSCAPAVVRGFNYRGQELNNGALSHNEHKGQPGVNGTLLEWAVEYILFNVWQPLTFNSPHAWEEKNKVSDWENERIRVWRSWRIRSLCTDHSCRYPGEHCSHNSVCPSVSECIFLKSSSFWMWFALTHRNRKCTSVRHSAGSEWDQASLVIHQVAYYALYDPNPFQTSHNPKLRAKRGKRPFWLPPCHRSWLAAILSEVEKPHLSMELVIASHQSSPSRAQAVLSAPWKQDQGGCRGDKSVSGSLSRYQHWRPFHRAGLSRPNPRVGRAINDSEEADASTTQLHVGTELHTHTHLWDYCKTALLLLLFESNFCSCVSSFTPIITIRIYLFSPFCLFADLLTMHSLASNTWNFSKCAACRRI